MRRYLQFITESENDDIISLGGTFITPNINYTSIKKYLEDGGDPNFIEEDNERGFLHHAIITDIKTIELLIKYGIDVDEKTAAGFTPLTHYINTASIDEPAKYEIIKLLLDNGANPNIWTDYEERGEITKFINPSLPIVYSCAKCYKSIFNLLIEYGSLFYDACYLCLFDSDVFDTYANNDRRTTYNHKLVDDFIKYLKSEEFQIDYLKRHKEQGETEFVKIEKEKLGFINKKIKEIYPEINYRLSAGSWGLVDL